MAWVYLVAAGLFEIVWAIGLKYTDGFTRLGPSMLTLGTMAISFFLLSQAVREIPIGTGYAIWTGIGVVGTTVVGILVFGESAAVVRLLCIALVVAGILGLKATAASS